MPLPRSLSGRRIAFCGARRSTELSALIAKLGGEPLERPMMSSLPLDDPAVRGPAVRFLAEGSDWLVATTGMGMRALHTVARQQGAEQAFLDALGAAHIAARGYKTVKALKGWGFTPEVQDDDGTVEGLLRQLEPYDLAGRRVTVQLHGTPLPEVSDRLRERGAEVFEIPLYRYGEPTERDVLHFVLEIATGRIDAAAFTSNTQVRFLFAVAHRLGIEGYLTEAFGARVLAVSVGIMTTRALKERGVDRIVAAQQERMGAMIMALAEHYRQEAMTRGALPVVLTSLPSWHTVVIGGGPVAERKIRSLLEGGAHPHVISPTLTAGLEELARAARIGHERRRYRPGDLHGAQLVVVATGDDEVDHSVAAEAAARGALINVAGPAAGGSIDMVGVVRRDDLLLTVSSGGAAPALTAHLRCELAERYGPAYGSLLELLAERRGELKRLGPEARRELLEWATAPEALAGLADGPDRLRSDLATYLALHLTAHPPQPAAERKPV